MASAILTSAKHGAYLAIALLWRGDLAKRRTAPFQCEALADNPGVARDPTGINPLATVDRAERLGVAGA